MNTNRIRHFQPSPDNGSSALFRQFINMLAIVHNAEKQLTLALPLIAEGARSKKLKRLVEIHHRETEGHLETLETIARSQGVDLPKKTCRVTKALIKKCVGIISAMRDTEVLDIALIAAVQKIEHHEIASYGTLSAWAEELRFTHETALLRSIQEQEEQADKSLTEVARHIAPLRKQIERASLKKIKPAMLPKHNPRFRI